jgi:5-methylcytosine-specific restriction protein A
MIEAFLAKKGFQDIRDERTYHGKTQSQTIHAQTPSGVSVSMRVKLCWRRQKPGAATKSAAQLMARAKHDQWEASIQARLDNYQAEGITHLLLVQREANAIALAALAPLSVVLPIWCAQRDVSTMVIESGRFKNRTKNHAMNGSSPTLWLRDEAAPEVPAQLWDHPDVVDIGSGGSSSLATIDDTYNDLPGIDIELIGADGGKKLRVQRSYVRRDPKVRAAVRRRAQGVCERAGCGAHRDYPGFLDVHHILGVAKSDRVFNCVALCPNCHRDAHFGPNSVAINDALLAIAKERSKAKSIA